MALITFNCSACTNSYEVELDENRTIIDGLICYECGNPMVEANA